MQHKLQVYNTRTRSKEVFEPLNAPFVGMYVCGPTVYGDAHLGHARPGITFDLVFRYLKLLGYKVRYVRNITDVGHLENDADQGEDKIAKKARLEQVEPMEIAQYYSDRYHANMAMLNVLPPSIEPRASGHVIEQIELIKKIIENGFGYVVDGSVYFDILKFNEKYGYGQLSGRVIDELISNTRELEGQEEKRNSIDFALWKKAQPEHIMRWPSPWSDGFPGWHLECSAMSSKYLGEVFDIHGGGMDLLFPHHESEIAQSKAANGKEPVRYWLHNNMITINGQKMGKSLNNFITLNEFFTGSHTAITQAFDPMTIRFFILQAHYRGTLDFSNDALIAAEKGMKRLMTGFKALNKVQAATQNSAGVHEFLNNFSKNCFEAMNDDFNSPVLIAQLFEAVRFVNLMIEKKETLDAISLDSFKETFKVFLMDVLGINDENSAGDAGLTGGLMDIIIGLRRKVRENKDYAASDWIRDELQKLSIALKDSKEGTDWNRE
ncbi:MAG: cysteine--tRNA ligase [Bacteroidota bacterium]